MAATREELLAMRRAAHTAGDTGAAARYTARLLALPTSPPDSPAPPSPPQGATMPSANALKGALQRADANSEIPVARRKPRAAWDTDRPKLDKIQKETAEDMGWKGDVASFHGTFRQAGRALKDLVPGTVADEEAIKRDRNLAEGRPLGAFLGDVAMTAVPQTALMKAPVIGKSMFLSGALQSILTKPVIGKESRLENAIEAGVLAKGSSMALNAVTRGVTSPIAKENITREGTELLRRGGLERAAIRAQRMSAVDQAAVDAAKAAEAQIIIPTAAGASHGGGANMGRFTRAAETFRRSGETTPSRVEGEYLQRIDKNMAPYPSIGETPSKGDYVNNLTAEFSHAYDAALKPHKIPTQHGSTLGPNGYPISYKEELQAKAQDFLKNGYGADGTGAMTRDIESAFKVVGDKEIARARNLNRNPDMDSAIVWKDLRNELMMLKSNAGGVMGPAKAEEVKALSLLVKDLDSRAAQHLPADAMASLGKLDTQQAMFGTVKEALADSSTGNSDLNARTFNKYYNKLTPEGALIRQKGLHDDLPDIMQTYLKNSSPLDPIGQRIEFQTTQQGVAPKLNDAGFLAKIGGAAAAATGLGKLSESRSGARYLLGDYDIQKQLAEVVRRGQPLIRAVGSSYGVEGAE